MSWLNFNDSLNSLKGQITNLAQTVLAEDDEDSKNKCKNCEELKNLCVQQELEIDKLKRITENFSKKAVEDSSNNENWNWVSSDDKDEDCNFDNNQHEVINLNKQLNELKNENKDLLNQLELLDLDNQENYTKLITIKDKLQDELGDLEEENNRLRKLHKSSISKEENLQTEIDCLQKKLIEFENAKHLNENFKEKYNNLLSEYEGLKFEVKTSNLNKVDNDKQYTTNESNIESRSDMFLNFIQTFWHHVNVLEENISELKTDNNYEIFEKCLVEISKLKSELDLMKTPIDKTITQSENENSRNKEELNEKETNILESSIENLNLALTEMKQENYKLSKRYAQLQENHKSEMMNRHQEYMAIIEEIIEKLHTFENISEFSCDLEESDSHILELKKQMEYIYKMFLDMKSQILNVTKEKNDIMAEKNQEIQKLIETSDSLSKEVIQKTQLLKEYENEIKELEKNNELILIDLEAYKTSPLETISESNEDKVVLLEEQLDTANNMINSLNQTIEEIQQYKDTEEAVVETDFTSSHLSLLENKLKETNKNYLELLDRFDKLQIDHDFLKSDLETSKEELKFANEEYLSLKSLSETSKINSDNIQQELNEVKLKNIQYQDDIKLYKDKVDKLIEEIEKLQSDNDENIEILNKELHVYKESLLKEDERNRHLETNIENLTEKLKTSKMAETSLKLQYDTLGKEVLNLISTKSELEDALHKANSHLIQVKNDCDKFKNVNYQIKEDSEKLKLVIMDQEVQLKKSQEMISNLNEELLKRETKNDCEIIKEVINTNEMSTHDQENVNNNNETNKNLNTSINENVTKKFKFEDLVTENEKLKTELNQLHPLQIELKEVLEKNSQLQKEVEELSNSRNDMIKIITEKHQENISYHGEIQRLMQILTNETEKSRNLELQLNELKNNSVNSKSLEIGIEKLSDENNFLKEKCEILTENLLKEQARSEQLILEKNNSSEEIVLKRNLERLQEHLIELEEHYTQELLQVEEKNKALQIQVNEMEKREKSSSTMYTSVNIRANQQVESLQNQLQTIVGERDSLRKQISDSEDVINKQAAALTNLQLVLEQFRKDKEKEVHKETERLRRHINSQKQHEEELNKEITSLKLQLQESKQGLLAASRLSDQLEHSKKTLNALKQEVSQFQIQLEKKEEELNSCKTQTDGKVDKFLLKNLILGFVTCNNNLNKDQLQILKIIATVLDFSQEDHEKINLDKKAQGSWLSSLLTTQSNDQSIPQESLSKAFIKFLENETKPTVVPSLLNVNPDPVKSDSRSSTPKGQSLANLSEIVLPTFSDFGQNRNSSSILKDVLKHNN